MKKSSVRSPSALLSLTLVLGASCAASLAGCATQPDVPASSTDADTNDTGHVSSELAGANLAGINLAGINLAGINLSGRNLAGINLAGRNLAGTNLAGTNLAGINLAGRNLAGTNLAGTNLAGTNLAGTNLAGTNLAGRNLAGTNLAGRNLAAPDTGSAIHGDSTPGLLWSGEDVLLPATARCVVLGASGTAFARLLSQQSPNARISAAVGKLPWGFASVEGGPVTNDAWEVLVWGDQSYCSFVLSAPPGTAWSGVAGFVKGLFRWSAPPSQSIDITGMDASASIDPTLETGILTYTGMMGTAAKVAAGTITDDDFLAGELALLTATTNNRSVLVDFSGWLKNASGAGVVLANVESATPPIYAESAYTAYRLADGTVGVSVSPITVDAKFTSAFDELALSYSAYRAGQGPRPVATRCAAALYLNAKYGEPIPADQCDTGLTWTESASGYPTGSATWTSVSGTTAPMNGYQLLPANASTPFLRAANRPIVGEIYTFLWEPNHELPATAIGGTTGASRASLGDAVSSAAGCTSTDDPNSAFSANDDGNWCTSGLPTTLTPRSLMYAWGASIAITSYRLTSAASTLLAVDPRSWTFQGCDGQCSADADSGWTTLDTRTNETFSSRLQAKTYAFANTRAYSQYRLRVVGASGLGVKMALRELDLLDSGGPIVPLASADRTENGTVTWTGTACSASELATRAFDNLATGATATAWCVSAAPSATRPISVAYRLPAKGAAVSSYRITTASDSPASDPTSWTFEGCADSCRVGTDEGWVVLDQKKNEATKARNQTTTYALATPGAYTMYRLKITDNKGDKKTTKVGEIGIF